MVDLRPVSSGAWLRTAADAVTAGAAVGGAAIGGVWAYFRYRRQAPDVPRVNAVVSATLFRASEHDYVAVDVELRHLAGGSLRIERDEGFVPQQPVVEIACLTDEGAMGDEIRSTTISSVEVLRDQTELGSSEIATDHKVMAVGRRSIDTIAYEVTLRLTAGWEGHSWTWCANALVRIDGPDTATGAAVVGAARA
jgi:hypothetical protein